jgi:glycosyltransferase involved in cell wall biosynthesis
MTIAVEAQSLVGSRTGVAYYLQNLLLRLAHLNPQTDYEAVTFNFFWRKRRILFPNKPGNLREREIGLLPGRLYGFLLKRNRVPPIDLLAGRPDLFFFPNFVKYPLARARSVVTVHDLTFIRYPEYVEAKNLAYLRQFVSTSLARADRVIAVSHSVRREILDVFRLSEDRVVAVPHGVDRSVFRSPAREDATAVLRRHGLEGVPYILALGTIEPRKNLPRLLEAYARLPQRKACRLVLAGGRGWLYEGIFEVIRKYRMQGDVTLMGYCPESDLPALYSGALLLAYPSFYEGFGMPILEAMSCGTPVLTSSCGAMAEVAGDAAVLIDPEDADALGDAISRILEDSELREKMIARGTQRCCLFSWDETARRTQAVLREAMQVKPALGAIAV